MQSHTPHDLAQTLVAEEVVAAGWFVPNTKNRRVGARRLYALTTVDLLVLRPWGVLIRRAEVARWRRFDVITRPVAARMEPGLVAVELLDRPSRIVLADVRPVDDGAIEVMQHLFRLPQASRPG